MTTDALALALTALYAADRGIKAAAVARFFARPVPPEPPAWPSVALVQPVTRGATDLGRNLAARAALDYPGSLRHVVVCDASDVASQAVCRTALPESAEVVLTLPDGAGAEVASKVAKMAAGVAAAGARDADVLCFVDDDIRLPPNALRTLVAHLGQPGAGCAFGLACQSSWENLPSALLSAFVNANALVGYIPLTYLTEPYTVTGHCFALRRATFEAGGGMEGLSGRFDDDHEIARRVRRLGLRCVQTPLVYGVANHLPTLAAFANQMRRWTAMPRVGMVPCLTGREKAATTLLSLGNLLPPLLLVLALAGSSPTTWACAAVALALFTATYAGLEARYLPERTPALRWWPTALPAVAFVLPVLLLLLLLLPGRAAVIGWRGQRLRLRPGGGFEVVP